MFEAEPSRRHRSDRSTGRRCATVVWVAVKVQRPKRREQVVVDLAALAEIASLRRSPLRVETSPMVFQPRLGIQENATSQELDYTHEAANLRSRSARTSTSFTTHRGPAPDRRTIAPPRPHDGCGCLARRSPGSARSTRLDMDARGLGRDTRSGLSAPDRRQQVFQADPHPGNLFDDRRPAARADRPRDGGPT